MRKNIAYIFIIILVLIGCKNDKTLNKLQEIDNLLSIEKPDSAFFEINKIKISRLKDERDSAYYYLLKTQTLYRLYKPVTSDSMINYSIRYYEKFIDNEKLARSYYYKGVTIYDLGRIKDAILNIKKSETLAIKRNDAVLLHKIYEALTLFNANGEEYDLAMKYAKLALYYSYKANNKNWMTYALNNVAGIYEDMGMKDSAVFYANKCIPLLQYVPKNDWIYILTNIGTSYISKNRDMAEHYLKKSLSIHPGTNTYFALATIYNKEGKNKEANTCWEKALQTKDLKLKTAALQAMFDSKYKEKNYQAACDLSKQILTTNKDFYEEREYNQVKETQLKYDNEIKTARERQYIAYVTVIAMTLGLLILILLIYNKYKSTKTRNEMMQDQMMINSYSTEISRLKTSSNDHNEKIDELKKKLTDLQSKQSRILFKGRKLYNGIMDGGTIVLWNKDDFTCFIEYYRLLNLPFVIHIEEDYDSLSPKNKFYEIMHHIGKTDEDISRVMGVTAVTIRVTKKRIKEKELKR